MNTMEYFGLLAAVYLAPVVSKQVAFYLACACVSIQFMGLIVKLVGAAS